MTPPVDAGVHPRRRRLRRGIVILPSAFTLGNLFLGIWAIVEATRGNFSTAGWLIVGAAFMDMFDGRIARFTATGSPFGEELDSLVDAVSFGVAPALIAYFAFFSRGGEWNWIISFLFIVAAILRLARFNIEQAGTAKSAFHGLPSPTAGVCVATFYAFTQTPFWREVFPRVNVGRVAGWLVLGVAILMISNVLYSVVPRFSPRTWGGRLAIFLALASIAAAFTVPQYFFFPMSILYVTVGLVRTVLAGFQDRLPEKDPMILEEEEPEPESLRDLEYEEIRPGRAHRVEPRSPTEENT
ncbi:MAG TPA: CDP-diacylglycerol--serine O-phosphatidyltransferase [Longimicrobiaceae bacterium]|nr:CDP-diacylglycerol--serine O-phosphatidyltransferase [Longimicrobiaceae bacterium]